MFDIGWSELFIVVLVAIIVVGPKELPGLMRTIGVFLSKVKDQARAFQNQLQNAVEDSEIGKLRSDLEDIGEELSPENMIDDMTGHDFEGLDVDDWNKNILDDENERELLAAEKTSDDQFSEISDEAVQHKSSGEEFDHQDSSIESSVEAPVEPLAKEAGRS